MLVCGMFGNVVCGSVVCIVPVTPVDYFVQKMY